MASSFNLQPFNATTYVDQLALQLGLYQQRLSEENAASFLDHVPFLPRTVCHLPDPLPANRLEIGLTPASSEPCACSRSGEGSRAALPVP